LCFGFLSSLSPLFLSLSLSPVSGFSSGFSFSFSPQFSPVFSSLPYGFFVSPVFLFFLLSPLVIPPPFFFPLVPLARLPLPGFL
jgi:hypothetical protein